jgi:hypothetical protein
MRTKKSRHRNIEEEKPVYLDITEKYENNGIPTQV